MGVKYLLTTSRDQTSTKFMRVAICVVWFIVFLERDRAQLAQFRDI